MAKAFAIPSTDIERTASARLAAELAPLLATSLIASLAAASAVIVVRAMQTPEAWGAPSAALVATLAVCGLSTAARIVLFATSSAARDGRSSALNLAASVAVVTTGGALSIASAAPAAIVGVWIVIALAEAAAWAPIGRHVRPQSSNLAETQRAVSHTLPPPHISPVASTDDREIAEPDVDGLAEDEQVWQQQTRRRDGDDEQIEGWIRVAVEPGQRTLYVHVAFCPPLAAAPRVKCEQLDGPEARIKTGLALPHGARFDLKLATAAETAAELAIAYRASSRADA